MKIGSEIQKYGLLHENEDRDVTVLYSVQLNKNLNCHRYQEYKNNSLNKDIYGTVWVNVSADALLC